jgi:hypothetical protein
VMTEVLRAMALAWEPEWGVVTTHQYDNMISEQVMPAGTSVGWVMYFSRLRGPVPPLPAPVRIEPVEDKGALVILTPRAVHRFQSGACRAGRACLRVADAGWTAEPIAALAPRVSERPWRFQLLGREMGPTLPLTTFR